MGTIRAVPMGHGLTLAEKLLHQALPNPHYMARDILEEGWELGRLVIDPQFRGEPEALKRCLFLALSFMDTNTSMANMHATCTPVLSRLYRRFGFEVVARDVPLYGTTKTYTLIHGPSARVLEAVGGAQQPVNLPAMMGGRGHYSPRHQGAYA